MADPFPLAALTRLYGQVAAVEAEQELRALVSDLKPADPQTRPRGDVWLLAYPTHITSPNLTGLQALNAIVERTGGLFGHIHVLPPFRSEGDFGFAPSHHLELAEDAGSWADIRQLARHATVTIDLILNHVGRTHSWVSKALWGATREEEDPFIRVNPDADYSALARSRHHPPITAFESSSGPRHYWTRYGNSQIDLDYRKPAVLVQMAELITEYSRRGIQGLRLDALAFLWKDLERASANEPEVFDLLEIFRWVATQAGLEILIAEGDVKNGASDYVSQDGRRATIAYRYESAPVILATILRADSRAFSDWIAEQGEKLHHTPALNFLSTHDGVYLRSTDSPISADDLALLAKRTIERGGTVIHRLAGDFVSPYELDISMADLLDDGDEDATRRLIAAMTLACWLPGTPMIYLGHLLGIRNDEDLVRTSGDERARNRGTVHLREAIDSLETGHGAQVAKALNDFRELAVGCDAFESSAPIQVGPDFGSNVVSVIRTGATSSALCILALHDPVAISLPPEYRQAGVSSTMLRPWRVAVFTKVRELEEVA